MLYFINFFYLGVIMSASDTLYRAHKMAQRAKGNGRERKPKPPNGRHLRGIIVDGLTQMAEEGEARVAEKLVELLDCGKPAIELQACAVIEKFTRDAPVDEQPTDLDLTPEEVEAMLEDVVRALGKKIIPT